MSWIFGRGCSGRIVMESLLAFGLAGLCLQSVFGPVAAQAKYAPFRFIYLRRNRPSRWQRVLPLKMLYSRNSSTMT